MVSIYGTLGPSCADSATLAEMLGLGMTGVGLHLPSSALFFAKLPLPPLTFPYPGSNMNI